MKIYCQMVKFTASMDVNLMIESNEINSNCKIVALLGHDVECIYFFQLLLSFSVTCLTFLSFLFEMQKFALRKQE